jgi:hypothetical protein
VPITITFGTVTVTALGQVFATCDICKALLPNDAASKLAHAKALHEPDAS